MMDVRNIEAGLRSLAAKKQGRTTAAVVRKLLPTIRKLRADGFTLKRIAERLQRDGVDVTPEYLRVLVSRYDKDKHS